MTVCHEACDRALRERGSTRISPPVGLAEGLHQFRGNDEIAEPQTGKQHLAETSGVEHALIAIDALEGRQRAADIAEFAVVIILDDKGAIGAGPGQQREPPRQR